MRVLVATSATQGARATDSMHCLDGELVWLASSCRSGLRNPYGQCAAGRSFRGMSSEGDSTTAVVRDIVGLTLDEVVLALLAAWNVQDDSPLYWNLLTCAVLQSTEVIGWAAQFPPGQVVERRGNTVQARTKKRAALKR